MTGPGGAGTVPLRLKAQDIKKLQQRSSCHPGEDVTGKLTYSIVGSVEGKTVRILTDPGTEDGFNSESFVRTHGLPRQRMALMRRMQMMAQ